MGQYYRAVNIDKKQYISPHSYDCGAKLMEFSYIDNKRKSNEFISTLHGLLNNEWKNDRVYLTGDYADLG